MDVEKTHMNNERKAIIYSKVRQGKRIKYVFLQKWYDYIPCKI